MAARGKWREEIENLDVLLLAWWMEMAIRIVPKDFIESKRNMLFHVGGWVGGSKNYFQHRLKYVKRRCSYRDSLGIQTTLCSV
jgi:hypothetical protein